MVILGAASSISACARSVEQSIVSIDVTLDIPAHIELFGETDTRTVTLHGTGFAVNGRIYTCEHVIHEVSGIEVRLKNGKKEIAKLTKSDEKTDLAELKIANMPPSLQIRDQVPQPMEPVTEIGNPFDIGWITTSGHFLSFNGGHNIFLIDTNPGNSGSPILDRYSRVIGMTHSIISGSRFTDGGRLSELRHFIYPNEN